MFHPSLIMIFFISILIFAGNRNKKLFQFIALSFPVITWLVLMSGQEKEFYELYNLKLLWKHDEIGKLIGSAFLLIIFTSNSYALSQNKIKELLLGSSYGAAALFSILAGDFISMFVGIEVMMLLSAIIIFIGGHAQSKSAAKKYFLTHLVSSNMILIGIAHIISQSNSTEIILVTDLIDNSSYSSYMLYIMFVGIIINIAAFPFSGWMANYYKEASSSGFLYLINFTTKVSIVLLIKLFAGFEALKYVAVFTILYAGFKAVFENHIISLLCYLSIIAMGIMSIGISAGATGAVAWYLFIHIIYKSLLTLSSANLADSREIILCSDLGKIKNKILGGAILLGVVLMINFPLSLGYYSKLDISHLVAGSVFYRIILLANLLTIISLPWYRFTKTIKNEDNLYSTNGLRLMILAAILFGFLGILMPFTSALSSVYEESSYGIDAIQQLTIFVVAALITVCLKQSKKIGQAFNLIDFIGDIWSYFYNKFLQNKYTDTSKEEWNFDALEDQIMYKISRFHNQQTAIFAVFLLFIVMVLVLGKAIY